MKKKKTRFKLVQFKWLFLVDTIIIVASVTSFGLVASLALGLNENNAGIMLCMIPPMLIAVGMTTFVILRSIRSKMDLLLDGIEEVANGNLDVSIDTKNAGEYERIYENFNLMTKELKKTKEEMNSFVNEFTHEFKTPITSIKGFAKYLANTGEGVESPERMKYINIIADEAERLSDLSVNTLLLSKVEACQILTDKSEFDLGEQIKQCAILMLPQIEDKNIELDIDVGKITIYSNEEFLNQVWINLISNAIKFTPKNGKISVSAEEKDQEITVSVSDNGIGMDEETATHIFEKYYQKKASNSVQGNGIGLSIVKRIVTLCNGTITVNSVLNEGSAFIVTLPKKM